MSKVVGIVNQKGGVAKTTSATNIAAALMLAGFEVCLVDTDPQGDATRSVYSEAFGYSIAEVMLGQVSAVDAVVKTKHGFDLIPADNRLTVAETMMTPDDDLTHYSLLKKALEPIRKDYDFIVLDTPPSLGTLLSNGLVAATDVLIPLQAEVLACDGASELMDTISDISTGDDPLNPDLKVAAVFMTMYEMRLKSCRFIYRVTEEFFKPFGVKVCKTKIKRINKFSTAPAESTPAVLLYPNEHPVQDYTRLVREVFKL